MSAIHFRAYILKLLSLPPSLPPFPTDAPSERPMPRRVHDRLEPTMRKKRARRQLEEALVRIHLKPTAGVPGLLPRLPKRRHPARPGGDRDARDDAGPPSRPAINTG